MAVDYTPAPEVEGEILVNNGHDALVLQRFDDGSVRLLRYTWSKDERYKANKGNWSCWNWVGINLSERKVVADAIGK